MVQKNSYSDLLKFLDDVNLKIIQDKLKNKCQDGFKKTHIIENHPDILSSNGFDSTRFENLIRSKLIKEFYDSQNYKRPYISITELFSCMRSIYYSRMKYKVDEKDLFKFHQIKFIQEIGNAIHSVVQSVYDFSEIEKTLISEKYKVKGRVDAIKNNFVCEIKTLEENKFDGTYKKDHYRQGNIYAYILNTEFGYNIDTVTLIYFFRNNIRIRPAIFNLEINSEDAKFYLIKAKTLQMYIQNKNIPECIGHTEEQCKFCYYKKYCEEEKTTSEFLNSKKYKEEIIKEKPKTVFLI